MVDHEHIEQSVELIVPRLQSFCIVSGNGAEKEFQYASPTIRNPAKWMKFPMDIPI